VLAKTKRGVYGSMTKEIPLTQGKVALIDDEDYEKISKFRWYAYQDGRTMYAISHPHRNEKILMHRLILNPSKGLVTDHIDGNGLNNQRGNLRAVTNRANLQNRHCPKSSRFPGVCWDKYNHRWIAAIYFNGKKKNLGSFTNEIDAANAYQKECLSLKEGKN
jgi:hypothetical protein